MNNLTSYILSTVAWEVQQPEKADLCAYTSMGTVNGYVFGNGWIAENKPISISFDNLKTFKSCLRDLVIATQGYAISNSSYFSIIKPKSRSKRIKRDETAIIGIVHSEQLASELQYESVKTAFSKSKQLAKFTCHHLQNLNKLSHSFNFANPTLIARKLLNLELITANWVSENILEVRHCVGIENHTLIFKRVENNRCFQNLPVTITNGVHRLRTLIFI